MLSCPDVLVHVREEVTEASRFRRLRASPSERGSLHPGLGHTGSGRPKARAWLRGTTQSGIQSGSEQKRIEAIANPQSHTLANCTCRVDSVCLAFLSFSWGPAPPFVCIGGGGGWCCPLGVLAATRGGRGTGEGSRLKADNSPMWQRVFTVTCKLIVTKQTQWTQICLLQHRHGPVGRYWPAHCVWPASRACCRGAKQMTCSVHW